MVIILAYLYFHVVFIMQVYLHMLNEDVVKKHFTGSWFTSVRRFYSYIKFNHILLLNQHICLVKIYTFLIYTMDI